MRLSGAMIYVKDLARMAEFYEVSLGLVPIEETRMDSWLKFDAQGARFALHAVPPDIALRIAVSTAPMPREDCPVKLIRRPWRACDAIDPEGNVLQMAARNG